MKPGGGAATGAGSDTEGARFFPLDLLFADFGDEKIEDLRDSRFDRVLLLALLGKAPLVLTWAGGRAAGARACWFRSVLASYASSSSCVKATFGLPDPLALLILSKTRLKSTSSWSNGARCTIAPPPSSR
jgi:hypothetical protein